MPKLMCKLFCLMPVVLLAGCASSGNTSDLVQYIAEVKARPQGTIEPLPPVRTFDPFIYGATAMRSPFDEPVVVTAIAGTRDPDVKPDPLRVKDFLESFNLDSLTMVGTLEQNGALWALVRDPSGGIHRVTLNNYIGKNHGKITAASPTQLNLVEIVGDGLGGWVQRPRTIKLSEKE
ncbi:pilus assembly protein PilP [Marinagarivorans algicola]|uniref:pilus assembly protein PilP n=1 Tax=Marinagarivorans algicola TaxID=1513270 RepID=UPI0006B4E407|nr:pilus assembly protein PilP [Marinagarivorans algicola]